jgi:hypothetical protein
MKAPGRLSEEWKGTLIGINPGGKRRVSAEVGDAIHGSAELV